MRERPSVHAGQLKRGHVDLNGATLAGRDAQSLLPIGREDDAVLDVLSEDGLLHGLAGHVAEHRPHARRADVVGASRGERIESLRRRVQRVGVRGADGFEEAILGAAEHLPGAVLGRAQDEGVLDEEANEGALRTALGRGVVEHLRVTVVHEGRDVLRELDAVGGRDGFDHRRESLGGGRRRHDLGSGRLGRRNDLGDRRSGLGNGRGDHSGDRGNDRSGGRRDTVHSRNPDCARRPSAKGALQELADALSLRDDLRVRQPGGVAKERHVVAVSTGLRRLRHDEQSLVDVVVEHGLVGVHADVVPRLCTGEVGRKQRRQARA